MVTSDWLKSLRTGAWRWQRRCQRRRINRRLAALVDVLEVRAAPGEVFNVHAMLAGSLPSAEAVMLYTSTFSTHDVRDPAQEWDRDRRKKQLPKHWGGGTDDGLESVPRSQRSGGGDGHDPLNPLHSIGSVNQFESRADDWVHRLNASPSENLGHGLQNPFSESGGELPSHGKPSDGASSPALRSSDLTADGNGSSGRMPVDSLGGEGGGNGSSPGPGNLHDGNLAASNSGGSPSAGQAPNGATGGNANSNATANSPNSTSADAHGADANASGETGSEGTASAEPAADSAHPGQSAQSSIAQIRTATKGNEITIDARGQAIVNARGVRSAPRATEDIALPYGMFAFDVTGIEIGGSAVVDIVLQEGARADTYYKVDPLSGELFEFTYDGATGAVIDGNRITLHLVDGGRGDYDGVANGVIIDPGGPGVGGMYFAEYSGVGGLDGWSIVEHGGSAQGRGTVTLDGTDLMLREGDSFLVGLEREIIIPDDPTILTFRYIVDFDTTTPDAVNDAFEVALVDAAGNTLTPTIRYGRDSYFNITEGESVAYGTDVNFYDETSESQISGLVDLDISHLAVGTTATLVMRLINNDGDTGTTVHIVSQHIPQAYDDAYDVDENDALSVTAPGLMDNDVDPHGVSLMISTWTNPAHGTLSVEADGSFSYTPDENYSGTDSFTYTVTNGSADSDVALVTITIHPLDETPVAENDSYSINEDGTLQVSAALGVLSNDTDNNPSSLTATWVSDPAHGELTLNSDGSFTYSPDENYYGSDGFTYQAYDGSNSSETATVTITVNAVNDAPVAVNDAYSVDEDQQLELTTESVLDNDSDIDSTSLTVALASEPAHGQVELNADGTFIYTPDANFQGTDSFIYQTNDGAINSNPVAVTITVNSVNDLPDGADDTYYFKEDGSYNVSASSGVLSNDNDVDGDSLVVSLVDDASHGDLTLNADGSFSYVVDADYYGTDSFTYKANDGIDDSTTTTVTLVIDPRNDRPVAVNDSYSVDEDDVLTISAGSGVLSNDTDADTDDLTALLVTNVSHGELALNSDGSFTYTPSADFSGTDSFTYRNHDGTVYSSPTTVSITVNAVNDAPEGEDDDYSVNEDQELTIAAASGVLANDNDADDDSLSVTLVDDVVHGELTLNADGSFSYTPDADYFGTDSFTYTANDGTDDSATTTVTITVNPINDAPVAVNDAYSVDEDGVMTINAGAGVLSNDVDVDEDDLTAALINGNPNVIALSRPRHGTLTFNSDGSFTYTPFANYSGTDSFKYRANDGELDSNVATVTMTVNPINDAPTANDDTYSMNEDAQLTVGGLGVRANDKDVDGDSLTVALVSDVSHGTLSLSSNGTFTYTPDTNYSGTDSFTYEVNDGTVDSNTATVTITISAVNDAPIAVADSYSVDEDGELEISAPGVLSNDTDGDSDPLTAVLVSGTAHGELTLNSDGSFTYTPDDNFNGTDSFSYKANDGSVDSTPVAVTITVDAVNDAPEGEDDTYSVDEDQTLAVAAADGLLANDSDLELDSLTVDLVDDVAHGNLTLNSDGSFSYTPDADYYGADSFTYTVNDGTDDSAETTVSISVFPINDAPVAANDSFSTDEDQQLTINAGAGVLANDSDVDVDDLTALRTIDVQSSWGPYHGTLAFNADGSFTYTPDANYSGADLFKYRVSDGELYSNIATVTITVNAVDDAPVTAGDSYAVNEDDTLTVSGVAGVLVNDSDIEGSSLTAALLNGPAHGSLTFNSNGSFEYTPDADYSGSDSFTYKANDGSLDSTTTTVTIAVNAVNDAPVAVSDAFEVDEDDVLTVDAASGTLANDVDADGNSLSASLISGPEHGDLTFNANGSFEYTPDDDFSGTDSFTYKINDGLVDSAVTTVTITVAPVNDTPVADDDAYTTGEDQTLNVAAGIGVLMNDDDLDGDSLEAVLVEDVSHGTLTLNADGSFTYNPDADFNGTDSFTYKANDATVDSNTVTVTITVTAVNDGADVDVPDVSGEEGESIELSATFTDAEIADTHTAVIDWGDGTTSIGVVDEEDGSGTVTGSHIYADNGSYTVTVYVTDNHDTVGSATATVTVANVAPDLVAGLSYTKDGNNETAVVISGRFDDPGFDFPEGSTSESFTVTIDWGDGVEETIASDVVQGSEGVLTRGTFSAAHSYSQGGVFTATVTVTDDDGGSGTAAFTYGILSFLIDERPTINLKANGRIPVLVYGDAGIDLTDINPQTVQFGPAGAPPDDNNGWHLKGNGDVIAKFQTQQTGIRPTDTSVYITAQLYDGTFVIGMDRIRISSGSDNEPGGVTPPAPVPAGFSKFYVADASQDRIYRYEADGDPSQSIAIDRAIPDARGVAIFDASTEDMTDALLWTVGNTQQVAVQKVDGTSLGSWRAFGIENPQGIATDGRDVWIVDAETLTVKRYAELARQVDFFGIGIPTSSFDLHEDNVSPSDITTDGAVLWVVDDVADKVFVYDLEGN